MGHKNEIREKVKREAERIADTYVNIPEINKILGLSDEVENSDFVLTKQTLKNIAEWALDGKSQTEIANKLELSPTEWAFLIKQCPAVMMIMERSTAYADIAVAGTLLQVALGGRKIKKKVPMKVKTYDECGRVCGEDYKIVEIEEEAEPNFYALKYLAEHKLSEKLGDKSASNTNEKHKEFVESFDADEDEVLEGIINAEKSKGSD